MAYASYQTCCGCFSLRNGVVAAVILNFLTFPDLLHLIAAIFGLMGLLQDNCRYFYFMWLVGIIDLVLFSVLSTVGIIAAASIIRTASILFLFIPAGLIAWFGYYINAIVYSYYLLIKQDVSDASKFEKLPLRTPVIV